MFALAEFLEHTRRPAVMGIVNATGDSFSEGPASAPETAVGRALKLLDDGADILDLGGESTRPGSAPVTEAEEIRRVVPVLKEIKRQRPGTVCSVDTRHAAVAAAALEAGAEIVNDVSMLRNAPELAELTARYGAALVLCHSRGTPETMQSPEFCSYPDGVAVTVARELAEAEKLAVAAGVAPENILLDPGFGFAKTAEQNWELAAHLDRIARPEKLLIGLSRKRFLGELTGEKEPALRGGATLTVELLLSGRAGVVRTHDVRQLVQALLVAERLHEAERAS